MDNEISIRIEECLAGMDDSKRELTRPILTHYAWIVCQISKLQRRIDEEGILVEVEKGGKGNRYTVIAENPAVGTLHKLTSEEGNHYAKLMRFLSKAEAEQVDALQEFLITR